MPSQVAKTGAGRAIAAVVLAALLPQAARGSAHTFERLSEAPDAGALEFDGGAPDAGRYGDALYAQCPANDPTQPATQDADGSWRLPPQRAARQACLLVTCDERRKQLEVAPPPLGTTSLLFSAIALVVGLALGGYVGWTAARWLPR